MTQEKLPRVLNGLILLATTTNRSAELFNEPLTQALLQALSTENKL